MRSLALEAFSGLTGRLIWLGLLNGLWLGLFTASACALVFRAAPRLSHRVRHAVLVVAMAIVATGPVVLTAAQHFVGTLPMTDEPAESEFVVIAGIPSGELHAAQTTSRFQHPQGRPVRSGHLQVPWMALSHAIALALRIQPIIVPVWLLVVASLLIMLGLGARGTQRLCKKADSAPEIIHERTRRLARRMRLRNVPRVLIHPSLNEPYLCGVFRSVILLPGPWIAGAPPERLDAILAHELAHARRLDPLMNLAQRLVESLLFFHPAVHWLSRSLRRERELCTDALAVRLTRDPLALAEALESVARLRLHLRSPAGIPIVGTSLGGQTGTLLPRIQELIGMTPTRPRNHVWPFAALPAAVVIALIATAAGLARDQPHSSATVARAVGAPASSSTQATAREHNPVKDVPLLDVSLDAQTDTGPDPWAKLQILAPSSPYSDNQICYHVRFIKLDANPWRELLKDRLKLVKQEGDVSAWIMDDKALTDLLTEAPREVATSILQSPKVTTFEYAHATIFNREKLFYVARVERLQTAESTGFRPIIKDMEIGWKVDLTGSFLAHGTRLTLDLVDSSVSSIHTLVRKEQFGDQALAGTYQVPTAIKRRCEISCDVPDGSHVAISLGLFERSTSHTGAARVASQILEFAGLPRLETNPVTSERLVIITPLRIVVEGEEVRVPAADRAEHKPKKS